jgi:hypothetical protein
MPFDEHDFRKALIGHIALLQIELDRVASSIDASAMDARRDELERIHERMSNVIAVMKADLHNLS